MCTIAGPSEMVVIGLVIGLPLLGLPLGLAVASWRRPNRTLRAVTGIVSLVSLVALIGVFSSPAELGSTPPGARAREPWWILALALLSLAGVGWLALALRPTLGIRSIPLGLTILGILVAIGIYLHSSTTALGDCEFRMLPPTVPTAGGPT